MLKAPGDSTCLVPLRSSMVLYMWSKCNQPGPWPLGAVGSQNGQSSAVCMYTWVCQPGCEEGPRHSIVHPQICLSVSVSVGMSAFVPLASRCPWHLVSCLKYFPSAPFPRWFSNLILLRGLEMVQTQLQAHIPHVADIH